MEVEVIIPVDDVKFNRIFSFNSKEDGTWNSIAFYLMITKSNLFLKEYNFIRYSSHEPNINELVKKYPDLSGLTINEIGKELLLRYLQNKVTIEEIEEYLNKPSDYEELIINIQKGLAYDNIEKMYGKQYPIFSNKIQNIISNGIIYKENIDNYLKRQLDYYDNLIKTQKIENIEGGYLDKIERALQYRKALKDAEKASKKEKRKAKKGSL